jgi:hypothetical protein
LERGYWVIGSIEKLCLRVPKARCSIFVKSHGTLGERCIHP